MARLTIRVDFDTAGSLGPGKIRLLEAISETGSIRKAANRCKMSFRQAWLLLQALEAMFADKLTETARGGVEGGGTRLTALGGMVVSRYRSLERAAEHAASPDLAVLAARIRHPNPATEGSREGRVPRILRKSLKK